MLQSPFPAVPYAFLAVLELSYHHIENLLFPRSSSLSFGVALIAVDLAIGHRHTGRTTRSTSDARSTMVKGFSCASSTGG